MSYSIRVDLNVRPSALKHGVAADSVAHAVNFALYADDDFQESDPPKVLILGPDPAGNVLELIGDFDEDTLTIFHAMIARPALLRLLNQ